MSLNFSGTEELSVSLLSNSSTGNSSKKRWDAPSSLTSRRDTKARKAGPCLFWGSFQPHVVVTYLEALLYNAWDYKWAAHYIFS
jgi:hypothetical protein